MLQYHQRLYFAGIADAHAFRRSLLRYKKLITALLPKVDQGWSFRAIGAKYSMALDKYTAIGSTVPNHNRLTRIDCQFLGSDVGITIDDPFLRITLCLRLLSAACGNNAFYNMRIHIFSQSIRLKI